MNKYEFISFKEYPEGSYPTAIATVRVNLKDVNGYPMRLVVRYARKETKNGGIFWAMATHNYTLDGEKKYLPGCQMDSQMDDEMLIEFIKENVKRLANPIPSGSATGSMYGDGYPGGTPQNMNYIPPMPPLPEAPIEPGLPF